MARRKKRRRLGHITSFENRKVKRAATVAIKRCSRSRQPDVCIEGVVNLLVSLGGEGFEVPADRR